MWRVIEKHHMLQFVMFLRSCRVNFCLYSRTCEPIDVHPAPKQALAEYLKAEVRAALGKHGVARFVIKPVRRSYAFERPGVPHGQQWVLKVRYPAGSPALPLDLTGAVYATLEPTLLYNGCAEKCLF